MRQFVFITLLLAAVCGQSFAAEEGNFSLPTGKVLPVAPDTSFRDLQGDTHRLSDFRGRFVLLEFWAPWCAPCREGFAFLDSLQTKHPENFSVVAVTMEENTRSIEDFVSSRPVRFLVGRDESGQSGDAFGVAVMPTSVLIDDEGVILARYEGGTSAVHEAISRDVERSLNGAAPASPAGVSIARGSKRGVIRAWERGYLADPIMSLDGDVLTSSIEEEIHGSKEAAAGSGGVAGGGCGCN
jgi:thiol-disulfide isomerase/thioredoxin